MIVYKREKLYSGTICQYKCVFNSHAKPLTTVTISRTDVGGWAIWDNLILRKPNPHEMLA